MLSAFLLFLKPMFGWLKSILSDWRIIAIIVACLVGFLIVHKINDLDKEIAAKEAAIALEQKNNDTLRKNQEDLQAANQHDAEVIVQMQKDNATNAQAVTDLNTNINQVTATLGSLTNKINSIKTPKVALSPRLVATIDGIQAQRDAANPPVATK